MILKNANTYSNFTLYEAIVEKVDASSKVMNKISEWYGKAKEDLASGPRNEVTAEKIQTVLEEVAPLVDKYKIEHDKVVAEPLRKANSDYRKLLKTKIKQFKGIAKAEDLIAALKENGVAAHIADKRDLFKKILK